MKPDDLKHTLGITIREKRAALGFSQEELAQRSGLHRTFISEMERGVRNPSLDSIERLASALGSTVPALFARMAGGMERSQTVEVLLVEDRTEDVELTLRAFRKANFANPIHVVRDGAEAIEFLLSTGRYADRRDAPLPGLILLDLNLPKLSGVEVLRWIKADERTKGIPVVVLTESRQYRDAVACRDLGVERYIVKPVNFDSFSNVATHLHFEWAMVASRASG